MLFTTDLQCQDPVIYELMQEEEVSPFQLISAQLQVIKSMEDNWYSRICDVVQIAAYHHSMLLQVSEVS